MKLEDIIKSIENTVATVGLPKVSPDVFVNQKRLPTCIVSEYRGSEFGVIKLTKYLDKNNKDVSGFFTLHLNEHEIFTGVPGECPAAALSKFLYKHRMLVVRNLVDSIKQQTNLTKEVRDASA